MTASVRRTAKKLVDCYSFHGEDFEVLGRKAKRHTACARRHDRALCREGLG